jgi:hypothetical protein
MTNKTQITIAAIAILAIISATVLIFYKSSKRGEEVKSVLTNISSLQSFSPVSNSSLISSSQLSSVSSSSDTNSKLSSETSVQILNTKAPLGQQTETPMNPCVFPEYTKSGKCFSFTYNPIVFGSNPLVDSDMVFLKSNINDLAIYYRESIKSQISPLDYWINAQAFEKKSDGKYIVQFYVQDYGNKENGGLPILSKTYQLIRTNPKDGEFEEVLNYSFPSNYYNSSIIQSSQNAVTIDTIIPTNPNYLIKETKTKTDCDEKNPHIIIADFGCYYYFTFFNMYKPAIAGSYDAPDFQENNFVIASGNPQKLYRMLDQATKDYLARYMDKIYSNHPLVQVYYSGLKSPGVHLISFSISDSNYLSGSGDAARFYTDYEITEISNGELIWKFDKFVADQ